MTKKYNILKFTSTKFHSNKVIIKINKIRGFHFISDEAFGINIYIYIYLSIS